MCPVLRFLGGFTRARDAADRSRAPHTHHDRWQQRVAAVHGVPAARLGPCVARRSGGIDRDDSQLAQRDDRAVAVAAGAAVDLEGGAVRIVDARDRPVEQPNRVLTPSAPSSSSSQRPACPARMPVATAVDPSAVATCATWIPLPPGSATNCSGRWMAPWASRSTSNSLSIEGLPATHRIILQPRRPQVTRPPRAPPPTSAGRLFLQPLGWRVPRRHSRATLRARRSNRSGAR